MGNAFKTIVNHLRYSFRWCTWSHQLKELPEDHYCVSSDTNNVAIDTPILVVAPHADDELIGCHQLIRSHYSEVTVFYCGFLGSNPSEDNRRIRESEIQSYTGSQQCRLIISSPQKTVNDLVRVIGELKPSIVFIPSFIDWHPEHRLVNELLAQTLEDYRFPIQVGWYHVSLPIPGFAVNCMSVMNKEEYRNKWKMMSSCYRSQLHMDIKRFKFVERHNIVGQYAAESYYIQSCGVFISSIKVLKQRGEIMNKMKHSLGKMNNMYKQVIEYYRAIL